MTTLLHRLPPAIAFTALTAVLLAACGSSSSSSSSTGATSTPTQTSAAPTTTSAPASTSASNLTLSADPSGQLAFDKSTLSAKAGTITLSMRNPSGSGIQHGIAIQGQGADTAGTIVPPGGTSTVTATLKPGTSTYYCPVPGHKAAGMTGTLTIT